MKSFFLAAVLILMIGSGVYFFLDNKKENGFISDNITPTKSADVKTLTFKVYFGNKSNEKEGEECSAMSPVERQIPYTIAVGKESVDELLKGPTEEEAEEGYYTSINEGVTLQSLTIENGTAKADFSSELDKGIGGSCKVAFIRSQITNTLKQFGSVKDVVISINGRTEDILQP